MKENKNIDRLFQEKFRNLDVNPPEDVWENIELRLRKKKDRKVIPFWLKISGIAAAFIIGLGIYNFGFENNQVQDGVVIENDVKVDKNNNSNLNEIKKIDDEQVVSKENNNAVANKSDENKITKNKSDLNSNIKNNNAVANKSDENKITKNNSDLNNNIKNNNAVANKSDENKITKNNSDLNNNIKNNNAKNNKAVANKSDENKLEIKNSNKNIYTNKSLNNTQIIAEKTNSELKIGEIKKRDSTSIASVVPNAMEELLNEKETKTSKEPKLNRWQLSSNVAPIYFSSTSNGSPLDSELKNNSKSYKTNFSYGLGVNYAVNKKIKVRTGINTVSLNYDTNDVLISQNVNAKTLDHVKPNSTGSLIQIESKNSSTSGLLELTTSGNVVKKFNSVVNQQIGYLEIPLELSYKLVDKKFGIDVIGGVSTLLLNQNEVSVISSGVEMNIGEANNLNDIHFSTNVGIGFKYGFFKNFEARVEPVFKYQINTFIKDSGDFKPYFFGLYSGVTFTF
ncbi:outer membrane beta-barrel protein [Flavobacterium aquatile]|uniref:Outer membrane protein beta-barrel domain-containing protein n=1 Tax=Flavobacterium aquatile LMG 4008 = ATCC 11947 TaxID=1453498 RepID=A0A095U2I7_9FLAO|nr:outer membrane beta-barrel protein [Flavobacterium aquatile]KGD68823.1 hypothetical protein LG45_04025 [Flavobacterium aquatile LMG 4008 = ATCC 11947]